MALNKGVLQLNPFAKYAVAFPKISRSIFTLASSALSPAKGLLKNKLRKLFRVDAVVPLAVKLIAFNLDRCQICITDG